MFINHSENILSDLDEFICLIIFYFQKPLISHYLRMKE